jgi:hypothetical protein
MYLSAMVHNSFTMNNLLQSFRGALNRIIQDYLACHNAYLYEQQTRQEMIDDFREKEEAMAREINQQRIMYDSLQKSFGDANAINEDLQTNVMDLKSLLDNNQRVGSNIQ